MTLQSQVSRDLADPALFVPNPLFIPLISEASSLSARTLIIMIGRMNTTKNYGIEFSLGRVGPLRRASNPLCNGKREAAHPSAKRFRHRFVWLKDHPVEPVTTLATLVCGCLNDVILHRPTPTVRRVRAECFSCSV